jgi:hypothetical protein
MAFTTYKQIKTALKTKLKIQINQLVNQNPTQEILFSSRFSIISHIKDLFYAVSLL